MFDPVSGARLFSVPLGADFPLAFAEGLRARLDKVSPHHAARTQIVVNTSRMRRRVTDLLAQGPAMLMPRITLLSELELGQALRTTAEGRSALQQRMDLVPLVQKLLDTDPRLAVRRSLYDLSTSLAALMDEMQGEGVAPSDIAALDVSDQSGHWTRAKAFIDIIAGFSEGGIDGETAGGRQRRIAEELAAAWTAHPPEHPVIIAGSTGSRGATSLLMDAVARLPQGAVVLPGVDRDMPREIWDTLRADQGGGMSAEDHPQYRFADLCARHDQHPVDLPDWSEHAPRNQARAQLVSLALRPAPVTDGWLRDGPSLTQIPQALAAIDLIEASSAREEATAIAARLRCAMQEGLTAALITPDRMLTRQVTAALDRWDVAPDDSAGLPLHLSPPGRLLRHVAELFTQELTPDLLLSLLKHPLTHTGAGRNDHLRLTRELELWLRGRGPAFPSPDTVMAWAEARQEDNATNWARWIGACFCNQRRSDTHTPAHLLAGHRELAEAICHGAAVGPEDKTGSGALWLKKAGRLAQRSLDKLEEAICDLPPLSARDYADLFGGVLSEGEVRDRDEGRPDVLIWGTLEARVQGADLIILAGLNEGSWPEAPTPDPWLNRAMRKQAGLLLPERRIGLSAHDFQQAICSGRVVLSRSALSDDAQTVPSRWLNRLMNLLGGLPDQNGPDALNAMQTRGAKWINLAQQLDTPIASSRAPRPSPKPPAEVRPRKLSVTEIKTLVRDPYAIYAKHVLRLRPLEQLTREADPSLRGTALHAVFERFIRDHPGALNQDALMDVARDVLRDMVDWPSARLLWQARLARIAPEFLQQEAERQTQATPRHFEKKGAVQVTTPPFTLTGQADRIDMDARGGAHVFDYKTGILPTEKQQLHFDMQLMFLSYMALHGGFDDVAPRHIARAVYLGVGTAVKDMPAPLDQKSPEAAWADLLALITTYQSEDQGFTARRAMYKSRFDGDYDLLSRYGEWDDTDASLAQDLT